MKTVYAVVGACAVLTLRADEGSKPVAPVGAANAPTSAPSASSSEASGGVHLPASDQPIQDFDDVIDRYHAAYVKQGSPRLLVYINRDLVRDRGEEVEVGRIESDIKTKGDTIENNSGLNVQIGSNTNTTTQTKQSTGLGGERQESVTLYRQESGRGVTGVHAVSDAEARQIETDFSDAFQQAGALFVNQKVALLATRKFAEPESRFLTPPKDDRERREIESVRATADIAIELLARYRTVRVLEVSGNDHDELQLVLTATATRIKDGAQLAQVSSDSIYGFNRRNGAARQRRAARYTNSEIIQQVSLALMQRLSA